MCCSLFKELLKEGEKKKYAKKLMLRQTTQIEQEINKYVTTLLCLVWVQELQGSRPK